MKRRDFLAGALAAGVGTPVAGARQSVPRPQTRFRLRYAPHFGMFRHSAGDDLIDQLRFMADEGFTALEDNPGRKEPTTGEINYRNIFGRLHEKGYTGLIGMEHGNSRPGADGEQAVIEAYLECDSF